MLRRALCALLLSASGAIVVQAEEATLSVEIPRLQVAEYHRPYVAAWVRENDTGEVTNLALWYQVDDKGEGEKWLKDLRQWWRRSGRTLSMPADGFTGATRAPGAHSMNVREQLADLASGDYTLYVEASREVGGRELLTLAFSWPVAEAQTLEARGDSELGTVAFELRP